MVSVESPRRFPLYIPFVPGACLTLRRFVYDLLRIPTCRCGGTTSVCTPPDKLCQLFTQHPGVIIPSRIMGVYDQLHLGAKRVGQAFACSHIEHFLGQFSLSVSSTKFPLYPCKCYSFQFSLFFNQRLKQRLNEACSLFYPGSATLHNDHDFPARLVRFHEFVRLLDVGEFENPRGSALVGLVSHVIHNFLQRDVG